MAIRRIVVACVLLYSFQLTPPFPKILHFCYTKSIQFQSTRLLTGNVNRAELPTHHKSEPVQYRQKETCIKALFELKRLQVPPKRTVESASQLARNPKRDSGLGMRFMDHDALPLSVIEPLQ